jgi:lipopolysaccharide biosynthesis regulator YciM
MSQVELIGFPTNEWKVPAILPQLDLANASLHAALQADPTNRTANHRLGLISMRRGDFLSAIPYLEKAYQEAPDHRGIIKSLGYCYVWSGNMEKAQIFLSKIPEAKQELAVYVWWWQMQGRDGLSMNASVMNSKLEPAELNQ